MFVLLGHLASTAHGLVRKQWPWENGTLASLPLRAAASDRHASTATAGGVVPQLRPVRLGPQKLTDG